MDWQEMLNAAIKAQEMLVNLAEGEKRPFTTDESDKFNALQAEIVELNKSIEMKNAIQAELAAGSQVAPPPPAAPTAIEENDPANSNEYKVAWLNHTRGVPLNVAQQKIYDEVNLQNATTGAGSFIPTTIANEIISLMKKAHPILNDIHNMYVKGNFTINVHTGIEEGDADVVEQGKRIPAEKNTFVSVTLGGFAYGKLVEVPWQMRAMSIPAYEQYLRDELVSRLGTAIAKDVLYGDGSGRITGIIHVLTKDASDQIHSYGAAMAYTDFTTAMSLTSKPEGERVIYASEETYWANMMTVVDGMKRPMFLVDPSTNKLTSIFGVEVKMEPALKKGHVLNGKPRTGYIINWNKDMTVVSQDNAPHLRTDVVGWCMADGHPVTEFAWCLMKPKNETTI